MTDRNKAFEELCAHKEKVAIYSSELGKPERFYGRSII